MVYPECQKWGTNQKKIQLACSRIVLYPRLTMVTLPVIDGYEYAAILPPPEILATHKPQSVYPGYETGGSRTQSSRPNRMHYRPIFPDL